MIICFLTNKLNITNIAYEKNRNDIHVLSSNKPHVNTFAEHSFYTYKELFPFSNIIKQVC